MSFPQRYGNAARSEPEGQGLRPCIVTLHQVDYALSFCPRTIALKHGRVVYDGPSAELTPAFLKRLYGTECDSLFARPESDIRRNPPLTQVQVA